MLRLILALPILLLPNALHLGGESGIAGMNPSNLLFIVLLAVLLVSYRPPLPMQARTGYLTAPLIGLFVVLSIGFVTAQWHDTSNSLSDLTRLKNALMYPLLYFIYRRCGLDRHGTQQLIVLVMAVAALAGIEAILQGLQFGFGEYVADQRATGPFGDYRMANRAGAFFAMFLPLFAASALMLRRHPWWRLASVVGVAILCVAIMFTYSRQAYLIAVLGMMLLLLQRNVALGLVIAGLMAISIGLLPSSVIERVQATLQSDATGSFALDSSTASRFELWSGALRMWSENPGGVGLGRFASEIGAYSSYSRIDAHNAFVLMLAECGLPGLVVMLWLFWRLWKLARDVRHVAATTISTGTHALAIGFTLTVISTALSNLYGSPFFEELIMANFWVLCGLMERHAVLIAPVVPASQRAPALAPAGARFPLAVRAIPGLRRPLLPPKPAPRYPGLRPPPRGA